MDYLKDWIIQTLTALPGWFLAVYLALFPALISLISAYLGAHIARKATERATREAFDYGRKLQDISSTERLQAVIQGIKVELETYLAVYKSEFDELLTTLAVGDYVRQYFPVSEVAFAFYRNNSGIIGEITDEALRANVIRVYLLGESLMNTHRHYNQQFNDFLEIETVVKNPMRSDGNMRMYNIKKHELEVYSASIKSNYGVAKTLASQTINGIETHSFVLANKIQNLKESDIRLLNSSETNAKS